MSATLSGLKLFCQDKQMFKEYYPYIKTLDNLDPDVKLLARLIADYYDQYADVDLIRQEELVTFYDYMYPASPQKDLYRTIIHNLFTQDVNPVLVRDVMEQIIERHFAAKMIKKLLRVSEGQQFGLIPDLKYDVEAFISKMANPPEELKTLIPENSSVEELVQNEIELADVRWPKSINILNENTGGLRPKTFGLIYAYVNNGKTSFGSYVCASTAVQLKDTESVILYCGNEEPASRINLRLTQALCGATIPQIKENPASVEKMRRERGFTRVKIFDGIDHVNQVQELLDEYKPRVVFVDQITNTHIDSKQEGIRELKVLTEWYRKKSVEHNCSIIGMSQGSGDSENKKWLKLSDIYGSRVAIQGALDYAVGIGAQDGDEQTRYIMVPKNKFGGEVRFECMFDKYRNIWKGV